MMIFQQNAPPSFTNNSSTFVGGSRNLPPSSPAFFIQSGTWYAYVMLTIAVLSFIFCVIVACIIHRSKRLLLDRNSNIILIALLGTDTCIGIVGTITYSVDFVSDSSIHNRLNDLDTYLMLTLHFFYMANFMMVILVTLDRLLAVKYPYFYDMYTSRICVGTIFVFLAPPCIFVTLQLTTGRSAYYIFVLIGIILSVFLACTNAFVYSVVKEKIQRTSNLTITSDDDEKKRKMKLLRMQKRKSAIISISIALSTILFLLPSEICVACMTFLGVRFWNKTTVILTRIADVFLFANTMKDPIIYICMNRSVKREMIRVMSKLNSNGRVNTSHGAFSITTKFGFETHVMNKH